MKARITIVGLNDPESARRLSEMIEKAERKIKPRSEEKVALVEAIERKEAEFLVQGFDRA